MSAEERPPATAAGPGALVAIAAVLLLLGGGAVGAGVLLRRRPAPVPPPPREPPPVLATLPDFSLVERSGRTVGLADLKGKVWVADFIFTTCAGICPQMTHRMSAVHGATAGDPGVLCVTFTVDPDRDTPEVLRAYADRYGASADRWLFLRGPQADVHRLEYEGFKMGDAKDPFIHGERMVLVDAEGRIRGWYRTAEDGETARLLEDVRLLRAAGTR